ncbi:Rieske (2Fe-2S) protein [Micromonospora sp. STR1s_5]|nr:Rieske (2Fe-2S) protein [Micromonospora sp. STR1s_5]
MPELFVARSEDLPEGGRAFVTANGNRIGVVRAKGQLHAFLNICPHQGGPVCEGLMVHRVEEIIAEDKTYQGMRFCEDDLHIGMPLAWLGVQHRDGALRRRRPARPQAVPDRGAGRWGLCCCLRSRPPDRRTSRSRPWTMLSPASANSPATSRRSPRAASRSIFLIRRSRSSCRRSSSPTEPASMPGSASLPSRPTRTWAPPPSSSPPPPS